MKLVVADFETFWSQTHSLTKMSAIDYVMHRDTQIISMAIKYGGDKTQVIFGEDKIREHLDAQDWSDKLLVAHNMSAFDAMIFAWRFNVSPRAWGCTLAMARPIHTKTCGNSLAALVKKYALGEKDNSALVNTKGKRLEDFTKQELREMAKYNQDDTDQCYGLFHKLKAHYNAMEMWQIDSTIRMLVEPKFIMNRRLLDGALSQERIRKQQSLEAMAQVLYGEPPEDMEVAELQELVRSELASAPKFAALLKRYNVPVPTKPSPTNPDKRVPALAKTDEAFIALQEHENDIVSMAAAARLDVKSTILETRLETFVRVGKQLRGRLPIPLHYCGADTTGRWSGFMYNPQNLPRVDPDKPKLSDALRKSMCAPPGYKVVVADLSGIELRVNHFLWKVPSSMALYKASPDKADLYVDFASKLYNVKPEDVTKQQRQIGKVAHLGLGFGAGAPAFQKIAKLMGGVDLSLEEAQAITRQWRSTYEDIVTGWRRCHDMLPFIAQGDELIVDPWAMMRTSKAGIHLPSGRIIRYPALREEPTENGRTEWKYGLGRHQARIYAGKVTENCIAADTRVLTDSGWKNIQEVKVSDLVHDGVEFVHHAGVVYKSVQPCVIVDGVYMTPDHEVLTDDGWKEASQVQRSNGACIWRPDGVTPGGVYRQELEVEVPLPVRQACGEVGFRRYEGTQPRGYAQLRVYEQTTHITSQQHTRDEQTPGVRGVGQHDRTVPPRNARGLEKLRGTWDNCVRALAGVVYKLLGRLGAAVPAGFGFGPDEQRWAVLPGELSVGRPSIQHDEQTRHASYGHPENERINRHKPEYTVLPGEARVADRHAGSYPITEKPVYDILNCGPRSRFVVRGSEAPFVVHNCVQALARDVIAGNAYQMYKQTKLRPSLAVHDELVYVVPQEQAEDTLATLQDIMRTPPTWWPQLITWSAGDIADTYGDAK